MIAEREVKYIATRIRDESLGYTKASELCHKLQTALQSKFRNVRSLADVNTALVSIEYCVTDVLTDSGYRVFSLPASVIATLILDNQSVPKPFVLWDNEKVAECADLRELVSKVQSLSQEDTVLVWHIIEFCRSTDVAQAEWSTYCKERVSVSDKVLDAIAAVSTDQDLLNKLMNGAINNECSYVVEQLANIMSVEMKDTQCIYAAIRKLSMESIHNCKTQEELIELIKTGDSSCYDDILSRIHEYKAGEYDIDVLSSMLPELSYEEVCVLIDVPEASIANCESLDEVKDLAHRYL